MTKNGSPRHSESTPQPSVRSRPQTSKAETINPGDPIVNAIVIALRSIDRRLRVEVEDLAA